MSHLLPPRSLRLTALVALVAVAAACAPVRRKAGYLAPTQTTGDKAKALQQDEIKREAVLPPPMMEPREIRAALWDIQARQRKGEAGKALNDYADRSEASKTLEARFLAASAIPDDETSWESLKKISDEQPRFYWVHIGMAAIYARWKVRDQCEKEVNTAFELNPDVPYSYTVRGNLYRNIGEHQLAVRDYQTALRADQFDADARTGLALSRKALGQADNFRPELERALKDVPTQYEAAEALALLLDEQNKTVEARTAWERVESLSPKNRTAKLALARLRGDQDPAGAIAAYEQAAKISALSKAEQEALARLYRQTNRTDDEVKALQAITRLDAKDDKPWRRLAEIFEQKNDLPSGEGAYRSLLALNAKDPAALYGLGKVAEKRAQVRQAIDFYRQATGAGDPRGQTDAARLSEACLLPGKPLAGTTLTTFYRAVSDSLDKLYQKRLAEVPRLKGALKVAIQTDGEGKALNIDVRENTLNDPWLEAHLYYALSDAVWPKLKPNEPRRFTLTFDLPPVKQ